MRILRVALALLAGSSAGQLPEPVKEYRKPELVVHAYPTIQNLNLGVGCSPVQLTARIVGPEAEAWYCPRVTWMKPDQTTSVSESDCPPFDERDECWPPQPPSCAPGWHRRPDGTIVDNTPCSCTVIGYPRTWRLDLCAPQHPAGEAWEVSVRLERAGRTLARNSVRFYVK